MRKLPLVLLFSCLLATIGYAQNPFADKNLQKLYDFQDRRQLDSLLPYLQHTNPQYRYYAASGCGSLQNPLAAQVLLAALADENIPVRQAAAFSLGQIGTVTLQNDLIAQVAKQPIEVKNLLLEAIGKCANEVNWLASQDFSQDSLLLQAQALGLYRAVLKRVFSPVGNAKSIEILGSNSTTARFWAASYFARHPQKNYTAAQIGSLVAAIAKETQPFVKMNLVTALNSSMPIKEKYFYGKDSLTVLQVLQDVATQKNENYLVRINAIKALNRFDTASTQKIVLKLTKDNHVQVATVAAEFVQNHAQANDKIDYADLGEYTTHPQIRAYLLAAAIKFEKKSRVSKAVQKYFRKVTNPYEQGFLLAALANNPTNYFFIRQQINTQLKQPLNTFALEALFALRNLSTFTSHDQEQKGKLLADVDLLLQEILQGQDAVLMGLAATELRNPQRNYIQRSAILLPLLKKTAETLPNPLEIEAIIELQKTVAFFENKPYIAPNLVAFNNPIDWQLVSALPLRPKVWIETTKGKIQLTLFTEQAPASVANFVKLAKEGYFDNKVFHRIVANFVVQTGCPRGDGYGNVPFSIRSEFANLTYGEGALGMASAGKDTEGSQWFITHSPTPHLDGRYTLFGKTDNMDTIHFLEIGDKIKKVRVE